MRIIADICLTIVAVLLVGSIGLCICAAICNAIANIRWCVRVKKEEEKEALKEDNKDAGMDY